MTIGRVTLGWRDDCIAHDQENSPHVWEAVLDPDARAPGASRPMVTQDKGADSPPADLVALAGAVCKKPLGCEI